MSFIEPSTLRLPERVKRISRDQRFAVHGSSWMDREWSTSALGDDQVGWDWYSLELSDQREIMFYRLRKRDG
ncbi:MAG: lipocalin family protein [Gammaproteobacteria bacterium]